MTLGKNTTAALNELAEVVSALIGTTQACVENVAQLDLAMSNHFHISPFFGAPSTPSPTLAPVSVASLINLVSVQSFSNAANKWNLSKFKLAYLKSGSPKSIMSKWNNVN